MVDACWIGVDWGTTNLRAFAIGNDGKLLEEKSSRNGIGQLEPDEFEDVFVDMVEPWLDAKRQVRVFACGMVGARQGWQEAAYRKTPCSLLSSPSLTKVETTDPRIDFSILPGLCQSSPEDVMRGEETQIAGLLFDQPDFAGAVCLPGTHSKWADVSNGTVNAFATYLTGEMFEILSTQSVLKHSVTSDGWSQEAFLDAASEALRDPDHAMAKLFQLRAASLLNDECASVSRSRLSGMLIGHEVAMARSYWEDKKVMLIGPGKTVPLYASVLQMKEIHAVHLDVTHATLSGLKLTAKKAMEL